MLCFQILRISRYTAEPCVKLAFSTKSYVFQTGKLLNTFSNKKPVLKQVQNRTN